MSKSTSVIRFGHPKSTLGGWKSVLITCDSSTAPCNLTWSDVDWTLIPPKLRCGDITTTTTSHHITLHIGQHKLGKTLKHRWEVTFCVRAYLSLFNQKALKWYAILRIIIIIIIIDLTMASSLLMRIGYTPTRLFFICFYVGLMRGIILCDTSSQGYILHPSQAKRKGTQSLK